MDGRAQDAKWVVADPWSISACLQACHTHTDSEDTTQLPSYAYLGFEGWAAETKHESRGSSHKTQQRAFSMITFTRIVTHC